MDEAGISKAPQNARNERSPAGSPMLGRAIHRPIVIVSVVAGVALYFVLAPWIPRPIARALIGWDAWIVVFLLLTYALIIRPGGEETVRRIVAIKGRGNHLLAFAVLASIGGIAGLASEAAGVRAHHGSLSAVILTVVTIVLSWVLIQVVFALRYAHEYFLIQNGETRHGGLNFGEPGEPDFWDFVHFSIVLGAAAQTADIVFTTRAMRRIGTVHTLIAFGFNTAILATMINVLLSAL
jgi:uncharacterized membrane protein